MNKRNRIINYHLKDKKPLEWGKKTMITRRTWLNLQTIKLLGPFNKGKIVTNNSSHLILISIQQMLKFEF